MHIVSTMASLPNMGAMGEELRDTILGGEMPTSPPRQQELASDPRTGLHFSGSISVTLRA